MPGFGRNANYRFVIPLMLLGVVGSLGFLNWHLYQSTVDTTPLALPDQATPGDALKPQDDLALPAARSEAAFPQFVARPLFHPDRKPIERVKPAVVEAAKSVAPIQPPSEKLQLIGLMQKGPKDYRALIRGPGNSPGEWLAVGDEIQGWQLWEIAPDSVVLAVVASDGSAKIRQFELRLTTSHPSTTGR